jgi:hypothetical protein
MDAAAVTRRGFIGGVLAVGFVLGSADRAGSDEFVRLDRIVPDPEGAAAIGAVAAAPLGSPAPAAVARALQVTARGRHWVASRAWFRDATAALIEDDLRNERTVVVAGWMLARTEAEIAFLLAHPPA